jgi:hypothetical protein
MIQTLRNSRFTNVFWGIFSLYLFNLSADNPDATSRYQKEDLSINDQESMVEVVLEQIMGFEDALEEYEDPDGDDQKSKVNLKIDFFCQKESILDSKNSRFFSKKLQFCRPTSSHFKWLWETYLTASQSLIFHKQKSSFILGNFSILKF